MAELLVIWLLVLLVVVGLFIRRSMLLRRLKRGGRRG